MIYITEHKEEPGKANKMDNMVSINTPTTGNTFCEARHQEARRQVDAWKADGRKGKRPRPICLSCYARRSERRRPYCIKRRRRNLDELQRADFQAPFINNKYVRFHAFGEITSRQHYLNFIKIVDKNPHAMFALWTKNLDVIFEADGIQRRPNLIHIYSSPNIDERATIPAGFDKVFTAYSTEHVRQHNIKINCQNHCYECLKCYTKNRTKYISEKLK